MADSLWNWLGLGKNPNLHLKLGKHGSASSYEPAAYIDYGTSGEMPPSWSVYNVYDGEGHTEGHYYGTITVAFEQGVWKLKEYKKGDYYWLDGTTLTPYNNTKDQYQLKCTGIHLPAPPIITNDGWSNGQGNSDSDATVDESFWVQDYGMNEPGRWTADGGAIYQSTKKIGNNFGSRGYPIHVDKGAPEWPVSGGVGAASDGLWQIDIKIGSDGKGKDNKDTSGFCETFYLAERTDLTPGPSHYSDGMGGDRTPPVFSREIDILETYWTDGSAQMNLPDNVQDNKRKPTPPPHTLTGWNTEWTSPSKYGINLSDLKWSNVGGAPTKDFLTFGCLIRGDNLWLYAYRPDNTQWYCTTAIPKKNTEYDQKGKFVPYIGTWWVDEAKNHKPGFSTGYKNFIYLPANDPMIAGKNPKDNPEAFGKTLLRLLYVVNYGPAEIKRVVVPEKGRSGPSLTIGPKSFVEVSPGQVAGDLPWYVGPGKTERVPLSKVTRLPAVISFDSIGVTACLTAVAYAAPSRLTGQNVHIVNYYGRKLTGLFVLPAAGQDGFRLEIGPHSFVSATTQQVGGPLPWYVTTETKTRVPSEAITTLPAVFSLAPTDWIPPRPDLLLTAVAYPAK